MKQGEVSDDPTGKPHTPERKKARTTKTAKAPALAASPPLRSDDDSATRRPSPKEKGHGARAVNVEMDRADQVVLAAKQLISHMADDAMAPAVTAKVHAAMQYKVNARLTPELIQMYTLEYNGASASRGMALLDELQTCRQSLQVLGPLVESLTQSDKSAADLAAAARAARAEGVALAPLVDKALVTRSLSEAASSSAWDKYATALSHAVGGGMHGLAEEVAKDLQVNQVARTVVELCRIGGNDEEMATNVANFRLFVEKTNATDLLSEELKSDVAKVHTICSLSIESSDDLFGQAEKAKADILANKSGVLHKALSVLPSGIFLLSRASAILQQRVQDKFVSSSLDKIMESFSTLSATDECFTEGKLCIPAKDKWADLHQRVLAVLANASAQCKEKNKEVLANIAAGQSSLYRSIEGGFISALTGPFSAVTKEVLAFVSKTDGASKAPVEESLANAAKAITQCRQFVPEATKCLPDAGQSEELQAICDRLGRVLRSFEAAMGASALDELNDGKVDLHTTVMPELIGTLRAEAEIAKRVSGGTMEAAVSQLLSSLESTAAKCLACIVDDIAPFIFVLGDDELDAFQNEELESMKKIACQDSMDEMCKVCQCFATGYLPLFPESQATLKDDTEASVLIMCLGPAFLQMVLPAQALHMDDDSTTEAFCDMLPAVEKTLETSHACSLLLRQVVDEKNPAHNRVRAVLKQASDLVVQCLGKLAGCFDTELTAAAESIVELAKSPTFDEFDALIQTDGFDEGAPKALALMVYGMMLLTVTTCPVIEGRARSVLVVVSRDAQTVETSLALLS